MSNFLKRQTLKRIKLIELEVNDNKLIKNHLPKTLLSIDKIVDIPRKNGKIIKQVSYTYYSTIKYDDLVNGMVRERYSESEEFAILRKAISGISDEYNIYNAYVENCKAQAKEFIAERDKLKSL